MISKLKRGTAILHADGTVPNYDFLGKSADGSGSPQFDDLSGLNATIGQFLRDKPVALFPLRLETKFIGNDLWIRIFPDNIFIHSHEERLTETEAADGQDYWIKYFNANGNYALQLEAWKYLCVKYGTTRAAWIIRALLPTNIVVPASSFTANQIISRFESQMTDNDATISSITSSGKAMEFTHTTIAFLKSVDRATKALFPNPYIGQNLRRALGINAIQMFNTRYDLILNAGHFRFDNEHRTEFFREKFLEVNQYYQHSKGLSELQEYWMKSQSPEYSAILQRAYTRLNGFNKLKLAYLAKVRKGKTHRSIRNSKDLIMKLISLVDEEFRHFFGQVEEVRKYSRNWAVFLADALYSIDSVMDGINPFTDHKKPELGRVYPDTDSERTLLDQQVDSMLQQMEGIVKAGLPELFQYYRLILQADLLHARQPDSVLIFYLQKLKEKLMNLSRNAGEYRDSGFQQCTNALVTFYNSLCFHFEVLINPVKDFSDGSRIRSELNAPYADVKAAYTDLLEIFPYDRNKNAPFEILLNIYLRLLPENRNSNGLLNDILADLKEILRFNFDTSFASGTRETFVNLLTGFMVEFHLKYSQRNDEVIRALVPGSPPPNPRFSDVYKVLTNLLKKIDEDYSDISVLHHHSERRVMDKWKTDMAFSDLGSVERLIRDSAFPVIGMKSDIESGNLNKSDVANLGYALEQYADYFLSLPVVADVLSGANGIAAEAVHPELQHVISSFQHALEEAKETLDGSTPPINTLSLELDGEEPVFPPVEFKDGNWTEQQYSRILPDYFVAIGLNPEYNYSSPFHAEDDIAFIKTGAMIDQNVRFGFNPHETEDEESEDFSFKVDDVTGEITAHPSLEWLLNKEAAEDKGMAIRVPIGSAQFFSKIIVLGVKNTDIATGESELSRLLVNHQYTSGIELLKPYTSTNNTTGEVSGYSGSDRNFEDSFATYCNVPLYDIQGRADLKTDGQLLAEALGIAPQSFGHVKGSDAHTVVNGLAGGKALFPGTIGLHMEEVLDNLLNDDNRQRIRRFFEDHVSGLGGTPLLRIGNQPYGVVMTSNLSNFSSVATNDLKSLDDFLSDGGYDANFKPYANVPIAEDYFNLHDLCVPRINRSVFSNSDWDRRFETRFVQVLRFLDMEWKKLTEEFGKNVYPPNVEYHFGKQNEVLEMTVPGGNYENYPQKHFLDLVGLLPLTKEYYTRFVINSGSWGLLQGIFGVDTFEEVVEELPLLWCGTGMQIQEVRDRLKRTADPSGFARVLELFHPNEAHLTKGIYTYPDYNSVFLPSPGDILSVLSTEEKVKQTRAFLTTNSSDAFPITGGIVRSGAGTAGEYLEWLRTSHPQKIYRQNDFDSFPSRSLLFLKLRAAVLAKYRDLAMRSLVKQGMASWQSVMSLGTVENALVVWSNYENISFDETINEEIIETVDFETYAWQMTKWNLLLEKFTEVHPWLIGQPSSLASTSNVLQSMWNMGEFVYLDIQELNIHNPWRDSELFKYLVPPQFTPDNKGILEITDSIASQNEEIKTVADFLFSAGLTEISSLYTMKSELKDYLRQLELLEDFDEAELERIFAEHTDLTSHRLDAWIMGLFNRKLKRLRRVTQLSVNGSYSIKRGAYLGAYGYVENLRKQDIVSSSHLSDEDDPSVSRRIVNHAELVPAMAEQLSVGDRVYEDLNNRGFVLTPSIGHAVSAAILRSGYDASKLVTENTIRNRSSVNLNSGRVRRALYLLQHVRAGNSLSEVLGMMFEKGLHDLSSENVELDYVIHRLRKVFPHRQISSETPEDSITDGQVMDGMKLLDHILSFCADLLPDQSIEQFLLAPDNSQILNSINSIHPSVSDAIPGDPVKRMAIACQIALLMDAFDALGDLTISEGVYQIACGNPKKAAAFLGVLSGKSPATDPDIIQPPLKAHSLHHKVIANFDFVPIQTTEDGSGVLSVSAYSPWSPTPVSLQQAPRVILDSSINQWICGLLGDPDQIWVAFSRTNTDESSIVYKSASDLQLQPIDLLEYLEGAESGNAVELSKFILHRFRKYFYEPGYEYALSDHYDATNWESGYRTFADLTTMLIALKRMIQNAHPFTGSDIQTISDELTSGIDKQELLQKYFYLRDELIALSDAVFPFVSIEEVQTAQEYTDALLLLERCIAFGCTGLIPDVVYDFNLSSAEQKAQLLNLLKVAYELLMARISGVIQLQGEEMSDTEYWNASLEDTVFLQRAKEIFGILFGKNALFLPKFSLADTSLLMPALSGVDTMIPADRIFELDKWIHANGVIRQNVGCFMDLQMICESMCASPLPTHVLQFPYEVGDQWLGLSGSDVSRFAGYTSLLFTSAQAMAQTDSLVGFKLDEWDEVFASDEISSGVAVQFNQPGQEAPQAVLLSVPAGSDESWSWNVNDLISSVIQAMDMAKYRTLEPDIIGQKTGEDPDAHWGKIFAANAADIFPVNAAGVDNYAYTGIRPSFSNLENQ